MVTGCASGIGEQVARLVSERGGSVVGLDLRRPPRYVDEFHEVDLSDSDSIRAGARAIADPVDAIFNVAGIAEPGDPGRVIGVNFVGMRELIAALEPRLTRGAAIVNTASVAASGYAARRSLVAGLLSTDDRGEAERWCTEHAAEIGNGYAVSKDAVVWYTLERAAELAVRGIRINAVAPGLTETPILAEARAWRDPGALDSIPLPLGRTALPEEQAEVLTFLSTDAASYISGQILWVDGGYMAGVQTGQLPCRTGALGSGGLAEEQP